MTIKLEYSTDFLGAFDGSKGDALERAIEDLYTEYDSGYINDAIHEVAEQQVPIYYSDLWAFAKEIESDIDDSLTEHCCNFTTLQQLFQHGAYTFISRNIYEYESTIIYNVLVRRINERLAKLSAEEINKMEKYVEEEFKLDLETHLIEEVDTATEEYDSSNQFETLIERADDIIDMLLAD